MLDGPTLNLGALTLPAGSLELRSGALNLADYTQSGGTLQGGGGNLVVSNSFNLAGGTVAGTFGSIDITHNTGNLALERLAASGLVSIDVTAGDLSIGGGAAAALITGLTINLTAQAIDVIAGSAAAAVIATGVLSLDSSNGLRLQGGDNAAARAVLQGGSINLSQAPSYNLTNPPAVGDAVLVVNFGGGINLGGVAQALKLGDPFANNIADTGFFQLPAAGQIVAPFDAAASAAAVVIQSLIGNLPLQQLRILEQVLHPEESKKRADLVMLSDGCQ